MGKKKPKVPVKYKVTSTSFLPRCIEEEDRKRLDAVKKKYRINTDNGALVYVLRHFAVEVDRKEGAQARVRSMESSFGQLQRLFTAIRKDEESVAGIIKAFKPSAQGYDRRLTDEEQEDVFFDRDDDEEDT